MRYTPYQKKVMNYLGLAKVAYRNMWNKDHQLGYVSPDKPFDKINIAKDFPDRDVKEIALLHECGHIYFNHTSVDTKKEIKSIRAIFKELNRDFLLIMQYGGPMSFLNIAMDLEVNSKLLTLANVKHINSFVKICTPDSYEIPVLDSFRDYYRPLIEKLPEGKVESLMVGSGNLIKGESSESNQSGDNKKGKGKGNKGNKSSQMGSGAGSDSGDPTECQSNQSGDKGLPQLSKGLEDIMNGVSAFDDDFDDETQKALREEGYKSGDEQEDGDSKEESTVDKEVDKADEEADAESDGGVDHRSNNGIGSNHSVNGKVKIVDNTSREIKSFLSQILKPSMVYTPDSFKHYNRGTRRNPNGLLYNSIRRRNRMDKKKLGVLIDVSGSMDTDSIIKALSSLKSSMDVVSSDSVVVTWDTSKCEEFPITKIPSEVNCGGGTDMAKGLKYLVEEKNCNEVVIYSDFWTELPPMTKLIKSNGTDVYSIEVIESEDNCVGNSDKKEWEDYVSVCKGLLRVKNKR